jgi:hypothetical protein
MLSTWSAATLRQLSFRRLRAEEWLSTPISIDKEMKLKAENLQNVDFLLITQHDIYDSRLLPGISFRICVSSHASLHLVSTETSEEVNSWQYTQSSVDPLLTSGRASSPFCGDPWFKLTPKVTKFQCNATPQTSAWIGWLGRPTKKVNIARPRKGSVGDTSLKVDDLRSSFNTINMFV